MKQHQIPLLAAGEYCPAAVPGVTAWALASDLEAWPEPLEGVL